MSRRKRKVVLGMTLLVAVGLIVLAVWSSRSFLIETWYLHQLDSSDTATQRDAIEGLGQLHSKKAIPELEALVGEKHELAVAALVNLVRIGPASLDALERLLEHEAENRNVLDAAISPIGELGVEGVPVLLPLLGRSLTRLSWAGRTLLAIGDPAAGALAELLLEDAERSPLEWSVLREGDPSSRIGSTCRAADLVAEFLHYRAPSGRLVRSCLPLEQHLGCSALPDPMVWAGYLLRRSRTPPAAASAGAPASLDLLI